jgi:transposase-like protein
MVYVLCFHCGSENLVKNGKNRSGKQQYVCRACGRSSTAGAQAKGHSEGFKAQILAMYFERPSMRGIQRATGVSRQTLTVWLKKRHADEAREPALSGSDSFAGPKR